jgi:hypothetical protein
VGLRTYQHVCITPAGQNSRARVRPVDQILYNGAEYLLVLVTEVGRYSSVDIATRHGLDGPGIESRWGRHFPHPSTPTLGPTQPSYTMGTESFPEVKRPGRGVDHPPPSSAEVQERVQLYLYSTSGPSWPVIGWPLPLPLPSLVTELAIYHPSGSYSVEVSPRFGKFVHPSLV